MNIAIVGAGVLGRMLAWQLTQHNANVSIYDKQPKNHAEQRSASQSAGYTAAGMLAPFAELESSETEIFKLGQRSMQLWPTIVKSLSDPNSATNAVDFRLCDTLMVAHSQDRQELEFIKQQLKNKLSEQDYRQHIKVCHQTDLAKLAPSLTDTFQQGLHIHHEGCLSPPLLLEVLKERLIQHGATWHYDQTIEKLNTETAQAQFNGYDYVIDCRGIGAKSDLKTLRGVRGETILLHAPDVEITPMIRLMHPRHQLYVVPRDNHHYVIGATQIESDNSDPISVRSALELLSAAYSIDKGFAEASIISSHASCRPAMGDNMPLIEKTGPLIRANGLYRHGVLTSPAIVEKVFSALGIPFTDSLKNTAEQVA